MRDPSTSVKDLVYNCFYCMRVLQFCPLERTHKADNFTLNQWSGLHLPEEGALQRQALPAVLGRPPLKRLFSPFCGGRLPSSVPRGSASRWQPGCRSPAERRPRERFPSRFPPRFPSRRCGAGRPRAPPLPWRRERTSWRRPGRGAVRGDAAGEAWGGREGRGLRRCPPHAWFSRPPL